LQSLAGSGASQTSRLIQQTNTNKHMDNKQVKNEVLVQIEELEERIAPSSGNFPPGQFPSGNPAHAPGQSNPNEVPATNPSNK